MVVCVTLILLVLQQLVISTAEPVTDCGCPDGWVYFRQSCYFFAETINMDWTEAEHYCAVQHRSELVAIETPEENAFLKDMTYRLTKADSKYTYFWTAGSDSSVEGIWEWLPDGSPLTFTNWEPGQPDSNGGEEDCLMLYRLTGFSWHSGHCEAHEGHPLCEIRLGDDQLEVIGK